MNHSNLNSSNLEIIGIDEVIPKDCFNNENHWSFSQISDVLVLNPSKPPIEKLVKIYTKCSIQKTEVIDICSSNICNLSGLKSTGKKLIVHGDILQNFIYYSDCKNSNLQFCKFKIPFTSTLTLDPLTETLDYTLPIIPYIQDIYINCLNNKLIYSSSSVFFTTQKI